MATQQSTNTPMQREGAPLAVTLSEANARAWIVSTLLSDLGDLPVHHGVALFAERVMMIEMAIDGLRAQLDELDDSDAKAVHRTASIVATTFEAAHKVLSAMEDDALRCGWAWPASHLALIQASAALCAETARKLDSACGLGILVLPSRAAA